MSARGNHNHSINDNHGNSAYAAGLAVLNPPCARCLRDRLIYRHFARATSRIAASVRTRCARRMSGFRRSRYRQPDSASDDLKHVVDNSGARNVPTNPGGLLHHEEPAIGHHGEAARRQAQLPLRAGADRSAAWPPCSLQGGAGLKVHRAPADTQGMREDLARAATVLYDLVEVVTHGCARRHELRERVRGGGARGGHQA